MIKDCIEYEGRKYELSTVCLEEYGHMFETMIFPIVNGVFSGSEVYKFRTFDAGESRRKHEDILTNMENYISEEAIDKYFKEQEEWFNTEKDMNKDFIEMKIYINPWQNLVEEVVENSIESILPQVIKEGEYRLMRYGDTNEFYNTDGTKKQVLDTEVYSIPLSKCHYDIIFSLISSIVNNVTSKGKFKENKPLVVFKGCKVNGSNIDIHIGVGLLEE